MRSSSRCSGIRQATESADSPGLASEWRTSSLNFWTAFGILTFDGEGCFDPTEFERHQRARAELALAPRIAEPDRAATVVEAASRFVARGDRWTPSRNVVRLINQAALGLAKCPRL
jgi:hypothetical protein